MSRQCEHLIDYFNDQLSDVEKRQFEEHLRSCHSCQEELKELESATADLPFISEPVVPNEGMKDRVLSNIFGSEADNADNKKQDHAKEPAVMKPRKKRKNSVFVQNGLAAALVLSLIGNIYLMNQSPDTATEQELNIDKIINTVTLEDTEVMDAAGRASIVQNGDEKVLVVQTDNLKEIEEEQAYQVWLLEGEKPYRAGTFVPNANGEGAVAFSLSELEQSNVNWDTIAITLEPQPDNETPQGDIILAAGIEG